MSRGAWALGPDSGPDSGPKRGAYDVVVRAWRWGLKLIVGVLVVTLILGAARAVWYLAGPRDDVEVLAEQSAWLRTNALERGPEMDAYFPEGEFFTIALAAMAQARDDTVPVAERVEFLDDALAQLGAPAVLGQFGGNQPLELGAFATGWLLLVEVERARLSGRDEDLYAVRSRARAVDLALGQAPTPFLESYPGQTWPVDNVVLVAALAQASRLVGDDAGLETVARWRDEATERVDPVIGLLPHQVAADGSAIDGPRGTSQALIQVFWPDIDPDGADASWERFDEAFLTTVAGLRGVREYPKGSSGPGDVDSGPLILGVSLSASTVALAAAHRHGQDDLADRLSRQADLVGVPITWRGERRYAAGTLPVGDAFLAWARSMEFEQAREFE